MVIIYFGLMEKFSIAYGRGDMPNALQLGERYSKFSTVFADKRRGSGTRSKTFLNCELRFRVL